MTGEDAAMLVEAIASEAGAWEVGARAAATAVRLSKEEVPAKIMMLLVVYDKAEALRR